MLKITEYVINLTEYTEDKEQDKIGINHLIIHQKISIDKYKKIMKILEGRKCWKIFFKKYS